MSMIYVVNDKDARKPTEVELKYIRQYIDTRLGPRFSMDEPNPKIVKFRCVFKKVTSNFIEEKELTISPQNSIIPKKWIKDFEDGETIDVEVYCPDYKRNKRGAAELMFYDIEEEIYDKETGVTIYDEDNNVVISINNTHYIDQDTIDEMIYLKQQKEKAEILLALKICAIFTASVLTIAALIILSAKPTF